MAVTIGIQLIFGSSQREQNPEEIKDSVVGYFCFSAEKSRLGFLKFNATTSVKLVPIVQRHFEWPHFPLQPLCFLLFE